LQPSRADVAGEIFEMELRVEGAAAAPILIGVEELRATVGVPFAWTPAVQLSPGDTLLFVKGEGLPAGLELDLATGEIAGVPVRAGEFEVVLQPAGTSGLGSRLHVKITVRDFFPRAERRARFVDAAGERPPGARADATLAGGLWLRGRGFASWSCSRSRHRCPERHACGGGEP
jgi:hypothetical protein